MAPLALLMLLLTGETAQRRGDVVVQTQDERLQPAIDLQRTTEGTCGGRTYRIVESGGSARLSITVDGKSQTIENEDAVITMRSGRSAPVTQILCASTSFRVALGDPSKPVGYAYGFLRF